MAESGLPDMDGVTKTITKTVKPRWMRRVPLRTIVLSSVTALGVVLYVVLASVVASADSLAGSGLFAPWRLNIVGTLVLWSTIITGASALLSWILHVQAQENQLREFAYRKAATAPSKRAG